MEGSLTARDEEKLVTWGREVSVDVTIRLKVTRDRRSSLLETFCRNLAEKTEGIRIEQAEGGPEDLPSIQVAEGLRYHGVPRDMELDPFLESLEALAGGAEPLTPSVRDRLRTLRREVGLTLYVAPGCPFCPATMRRILPLPFHAPFVRLRVIDGALFPEAASADGIHSTPTLLLDQGFRWTGSVSLEEVVDVLTARDFSEVGAPTLERMLKEGRAQELARMMLEQEQLFPALIELLTRPELASRLGAMVTMEELAEQNPTLAREAVAPLWSRFAGLEDAVKGDVLYTIGRAGTPEDLSRLRAISGGRDSGEVREAAREAIDAIEGRGP